MIARNRQAIDGGTGMRLPKVAFPDRYLDIAVELAAGAAEQIDLTMIGLENGGGSRKDFADLHEATAALYECLRLIGEVQSRRALPPVQEVRAGA